MKVLLDTCVISELVKPTPNAKVVAWVSSCPEESTYLSAVTIGEIQKGITRLPDSGKKQRLQRWLDIELSRRFENRIVPVDAKVARQWGTILAQAERSGNRLPVIDALIAATGIAWEMTVATRNTADMNVERLLIINPWEEQHRSQSRITD